MGRLIGNWEESSITAAPRRGDPFLNSVAIAGFSKGYGKKREGKVVEDRAASNGGIVHTAGGI